MTIISTTLGKNSLEKNGVILELTKEAEMQYLGAISKTTKWCGFASKANHSTS